MGNDCKSCRHYQLYEMITHGPYGYSGYIPCQTCSRLSWRPDNYEPITRVEPGDEAIKFLEGNR